MKAETLNSLLDRLPKNKSFYVTTGVIALTAVLLAFVFLVSVPIAHLMEPYRQTPPADTTINVPTDNR